MEFALHVVQGDVLASLNGCGVDGWECVQLLPQPDGTIKALLQREARAIVLPTETERGIILGGNGT